jgi:sigma-B regulation protein RsbU (phosphoserine phosphatase)
VAPVTPGPSRARLFFEVYTQDLSAGDLQRLFTRDAREAYAFFARGIDREQLERLPWHRRIVTHVRLFLLAFMLRLSPARRMLYGTALIASVLGVIGLFAGFHVVRLDPIPLAYIVPTWRDGTLMVVTGFVLLNLLVMMEVADRLSLKHDLNVAREIQLAMLPSGTYRAPGIEVHGETRPANTVGGDFYDLIPQPDGRVLVALGDVAGKGSPAALLMALLLAILRTLVDEGLELPALAERLNSQVTRHAPPSRFITLFLGMYDPKSDTLTWLNAGQNPPMIRRASGEWVKLPATGVALGMFEGSPYEAETTTLASGDVLVMYSDGITEAESTRGVPFEEQGLQGVVNAWVGGNAPELSSAVLRAVTQHVGDAKVGDDLTVLVLKRQ